jgi:hypothetical protein
MRKRKETRNEETPHMRAIISAWVVWALIILGLVTSWAVQTPVMDMLPSLTGDVERQRPDSSNSGAVPVIAPFATAAGPASGGPILWLQRDKVD